MNLQPGTDHIGLSGHVGTSPQDTDSPLGPRRKKQAAPGPTGPSAGPPLKITDVKLTSVSASGTGLLGFIQCTVNEALMIDGITLRRTRGGRLTLSYPARRNGRGQHDFVVWPVNDDARREVERQVLKTLGIEVTSSTEHEQC